MACFLRLRVAMKSIVIIKAGSTFPQLRHQYGDFERWIRTGLGGPLSCSRVIDATKSYHLPDPSLFAGVIISGSHSMVTDAESWMTTLQEWIQAVVHMEIPVLGICFGHQIVAGSLGGKVGPNPHGREIGTIEVNLVEEAQTDKLMRGLPQRFLAHSEHSQSVLDLPPGAKKLCWSSKDNCHAFRAGSAWGVQFHPEFTQEIMRGYISCQEDQLSENGLEVEYLNRGVCPTPLSASILRRFCRFCMTQRR